MGDGGVGYHGSGDGRGRVEESLKVVNHVPSIKYSSKQSPSEENGKADDEVATRGIMYAKAAPEDAEATEYSVEHIEAGEGNSQRFEVGDVPTVVCRALSRDILALYFPCLFSPCFLIYEPANISILSFLR